jgi:opacity protein-like surface antigen
MPGHIGIYGIHMTPSGLDAERYSRAGLGGGIMAVVPVPSTARLLAGVVGLEFVNLLSDKTEFRDLMTGLRVEQQTSQHYGRLYLGGRFGIHGHEFFRPYAGANIALNFYGISTDVVVPDDSDREKEIRQNLRSEDRAAFGYDGTLGVDFDLATKFNVGLGMRFVKTFNVPQQLGAGSVPVSPGYFQLFLGFGVNFGAFGSN